MAGELVMGRVIGPFGVRGELRIAAVDADVLHGGLEICLQLKNGEKHRVTLETVRPHGKGLIARLVGYDDPRALAAMRGALIAVAREDLPALGGSAYREADLVGLVVIDKRLGPLGEVREVRRYPSCDMLVVGAQLMLVPMLHAYGVQVDFGERTIRVELPEGFEELA